MIHLKDESVESCTFKKTPSSLATVCMQHISHWDTFDPFAHMTLACIFLTLNYYPHKSNTNWLWSLFSLHFGWFGISFNFLVTMFGKITISSAHSVSRERGRTLDIILSKNRIVDALWDLSVKKSNHRIQSKLCNSYIVCSKHRTEEWRSETLIWKVVLGPQGSLLRLRVYPPEQECLFVHYDPLFLTGCLYEGRPFVGVAWSSVTQKIPAV